MMKTFPAVFGGVVAYILLILYAGTVFYIINGVRECGADPSCSVKDFAPGMIFVVTTIGGLVSALVISKLTITKPGENPAMIQSLEDSSGILQKIATFLVAAYLFVWVMTGLGALFVGVMVHPDVNGTLADIGTNWLGLAVAAGYAYFGLDPSS